MRQIPGVEKLKDETAGATFYAPKSELAVGYGQARAVFMTGAVD